MNLSKPRSLVNENCFVYLKMDGMMWIIYEILLTFDKLQDASAWDGSKPMEFQSLYEMCVWLLKEINIESFEENKKITVKLQEDYINYDIIEFLKIHTPEIMI